MALPSWLLVPVGGRRSQGPGPSATLRSLGPSHYRRHKSRVSLRGPHGVSDIPYGEVCDVPRLIHKLVYILKDKQSASYIQAILWIKKPQVASAERPRIRGLIHKLVYIPNTNQSGSLHTTYNIISTTWTGLGREASDPRPHTQISLHSHHQPKCLITYNL
jgi:hypothetical protein